jgi:hypothetical protein
MGNAVRDHIISRDHVQALESRNKVVPANKSRLENGSRPPWVQKWEITPGGESVFFNHFTGELFVGPDY